MSITIQEITDREQWNGFLTGQPAAHPGHLLQSYEWGELNKYLGACIYRLGALEDGRMTGAMLLTVSPVPVPGLRWNWLYSARGPTVDSPDSPALLALIDYAQRHIAKDEHAVVLRLEPNIADDAPDLDAWIAAYARLGFQTNLNAVHGRRSWVLDVRPGAETLLANFKMTWRQNVRIAERKGVVIRAAAGDADFDAYYDLLKVTSERDAFFIHQKDYHKEILRHFASKGDAVLYLAEHEGEAIAAKMLIRFGDWCWDMFGASSNNKRNLKADLSVTVPLYSMGASEGLLVFRFSHHPRNPGARRRDVGRL